MSTTATLNPSSREVMPGEQATFELTVSNDSLLVESYTLAPIGPVAGWTVVEPAQLTIYPGTTQTATVTVSPPRTSAAAQGRMPVGVKVQPAEQPEFQASAEAEIEILPFSAVDAELVPRISRGRGRKRIRLAIDNRGNLPLSAAIAGASSDAITITTPTPEVQVDPGHALFVDVDLRPRARVWRGADVNHPFTLTVVPEQYNPVLPPTGAPGEQPITLDGSYTQQRVFPRWLWKLLLALLLLLLALIALWFLVIKPAVEATAKEAIEGPVADATRRADAAAVQADEAAQNANEAKAAVGQPTEPVEPVAPGPTTSTQEVDLRLSASAGANANGESTRYTVPPNSVLRITDLVLQNPTGSAGQLTIENREIAAAILTTGLENFRDLDFHFVTPIEIQTGDDVFIKVECDRAGASGTVAPCGADVLVSGVVVTTH
ncbi:COG1470 family protein [Agromyces soli]